MSSLIRAMLIGLIIFVAFVGSLMVIFPSDPDAKVPGVEVTR